MATKLTALSVLLLGTIGVFGCSNDLPPSQVMEPTKSVSFSPDGRWLAYESDDGEIVVRPIAGTETDTVPVPRFVPEIFNLPE
jgi:WD40-like Beta Propeller Repeat